MVATRRELQRWQKDETRKALRDLVRTVLRESPPLFIGLSARDWNLQVEILEAFNALSVAASRPSKVLFAEDELKLPQRTVLSHILGDAYENDRDSVEKQATLGRGRSPG